MTAERRIDDMSEGELMDKRDQLQSDLSSIKQRMLDLTKGTQEWRDAERARIGKASALVAVLQLIGEFNRAAKKERHRVTELRQRDQNQQFVLAASRMLDEETFQRIWRAVERGEVA